MPSRWIVAMSFSFVASGGRVACRRSERVVEARPSPIRPVRTSSLIPCGRTSSSNESISSGAPTISKTIAFGPRSATRASKHLARARCSSRALRRRRGDLDQRELALDRLVRLELADAQDVDELVHLLLDLLERVLLAVDAQRDPRDVVALGRADREALDVVAAAREHARDAHQRARLVLDAGRTSVWITGPAPPRCVGVLDEVERGRAGRDHREAVLARVDAAVDDRGAAAGERLRERARRARPRSRRVKPTAPYASASSRSPATWCVEVHLREPLLEEHVLPLPHHPEVAVVDDHDDDRQVLERRTSRAPAHVIWKQPSPSTQTTVASGRAAFAPIAAGTP